MKVAEGTHLAVKRSLEDVIRHNAEAGEQLFRWDENSTKLVLVFRRPPCRRANIIERFRFITCQWEATPDNRDYFWRPVKEVTV